MRNIESPPSCLVSIIVPVYNVEQLLSRCLDSLLEQSFLNIEIILVNDGSTDSSPNICDRYAKNEKRIRVIHKSNGGLSSARLAGFLQASGKYVSFIDSDDYIAPDMIEQLFCSAEDKNAQLAMCGYTVVNGNDKKQCLLPFKSDLIEKQDIHENYILPLIGRIHQKGRINIPGFMWIRLYLRDLIDPSFFLSEREYFTEDDLFQLLYADKVERIAIVQSALYFYCQNPGSLSLRYRPEKWQMLIRRYEYCKEYAKERGLLDVVENRLAAAYFSAVHNSIDNACLAGDRQTFMDEAKLIIESDQSQEMLSALPLRILGKGQMIIYFLCRFRLYSILYKYRMMRIKR